MFGYDNMGLQQLDPSSTAGLGLSSALTKLSGTKLMCVVVVVVVVFTGFQDFRLEFLVVIFVCSPVFLWNASTKVVWEKIFAPPARRF